MRSRRFLAAASLATAAVMTLSSCSFKRTIVYNSRREIVTPIPISFSWWGSEARNSYTLEGLSIFEEDNDNKLIIQPYPYDFDGYKSNLDALLYCDKECDLLQLNSSWAQVMSKEGDMLYDLNQLRDYIDLTTFEAEQLSYCTFDGKLYGLPTSLNALTFYHNSFTYASYQMKPPETWEDLFTAAEMMSKDDVYVLESSNKMYWMLLIAHEEQMTGKSSFDDGFGRDNVISMMNFFKELRDKKVIPKEEYSKEMFFGGKVATEVLWVSDADFYAEPLDEHGGILQVGEPLMMPDAELSGWYVKPNQVYSIKKDTEHPKEAAELLNFLVNDSRMAKLQGTEKGIPLSNSALEVLEANKMLSGASYEAGRLINDFPERYGLMPPEMEEEERFECFFEQFLMFDAGSKTIEQAADDFLALYPFK